MTSCPACLSVCPPVVSGKLDFSASLLSPLSSGSQNITWRQSAPASFSGHDGGSAPGASKAELGGPDPYRLLLTPNPPPPTPPRSVHALCLFLPAGIKHMPVTLLLPAPAAMLSSFFLLSLFEMETPPAGLAVVSLLASYWADPACTVAIRQDLCVSRQAFMVVLACLEYRRFLWPGSTFGLKFGLFCMCEDKKNNNKKTNKHNKIKTN